MQNNKVILIGFLGQEPKEMNKNGKIYYLLNLATVDSFPKKSENGTIWVSKEPVWHDILIFKEQLMLVAKELKKGDMAEIFGTLSYKVFIDIENKKRKRATIVAQKISKLAAKIDDEKIAEVVSELVDKWQED